MRVLAVVAALTLAVAAPVASAPSLASSGCPLFPADAAGLPILAGLVRYELVGARGASPTAPASAATSRAARSARPGVAAAPALLPGVGRRSFTTEPSVPPAAGQPAGPASSAQAPDPTAARAEGPAGSGSSALLPQILTAILGLVAAALAFREVDHRSRRPMPGRHVRSKGPPDPAPPDRPDPAASPDPDAAPSRRP
jgi:hypothetical protein